MPTLAAAQKNKAHSAEFQKIAAMCMPGWQPSVVRSLARIVARWCKSAKVHLTHCEPSGGLLFAALSQAPARCHIDMSAVLSGNLAADVLSTFHSVWSKSAIGAP